MNGRTNKLLRQAAKFSGRTDTYVKKNFKHMPKEAQVLYLHHIKEVISRYKEITANLDKVQPGEVA